MFWKSRAAFLACACSIVLRALLPGSTLAGSGLELARGRPASQSSTYGSVSPGVAVDGNTDGFGSHVVTHTQLEQWAWWQVDLGTTRTIGSVEVWNRTDCCGERLQDFYVFVSPVPFTSRDPEVTRAQPGVKSYRVAGQGGSPTSVSFGANPVRGRFVRVQLRGTNYLSLAEVKVWGSPEHLDINTDYRSDITAWSPNAGGAWGLASHEMLPQGNVAAYGFDNRTLAPMTARSFRTGGPAQYEVLPGDFDGDGHSDLAMLSPNAGDIWTDSIDVNLGSPYGFWTRTTRATTPFHMRNAGDARYVSWSGWLSVELSTGSGFRSELWGSQTPGHMRYGGGATARYLTVTGDYNLDGRTDLVTLSPDSVGLWASHVFVDLSTGAGSFSGFFADSAIPEAMRSGGKDAEWNLLGHQLHALGCPTSDALPVRDGGDYQLIEGGRFYTSRMGTYAVRGAVLSKWLPTCMPGTSSCGVDGPLGYPTGDEVVTADGLITQSFVGGYVQASSAGAFIIPTSLIT